MEQLNYYSFQHHLLFTQRIINTLREIINNINATNVNLWNCLIYTFGEFIINKEKRKGWFNLYTTAFSLCYPFLAEEKPKSKPIFSVLGKVEDKAGINGDRKET